MHRCTQICAILGWLCKSALCLWLFLWRYFGFCSEEAKRARCSLCTPPVLLSDRRPCREEPELPGCVLLLQGPSSEGRLVGGNASISTLLLIIESFSLHFPVFFFFRPEFRLFFSLLYVLYIFTLLLYKQQYIHTKSIPYILLKTCIFFCCGT